MSAIAGNQKRKISSEEKGGEKRICCRADIPTFEYVMCEVVLPTLTSFLDLKDVIRRMALLSKTVLRRLQKPRGKLLFQGTMFANLYGALRYPLFRAAFPKLVSQSLVLYVSKAEEFGQAPYLLGHPQLCITVSSEVKFAHALLAIPRMHANVSAAETLVIGSSDLEPYELYVNDISFPRLEYLSVHGPCVNPHHVIRNAPSLRDVDIRGAVCSVDVLLEALAESACADSLYGLELSDSRDTKDLNLEKWRNTSFPEIRRLGLLDWGIPLPLIADRLQELRLWISSISQLGRNKSVRAERMTISLAHGLLHRREIRDWPLKAFSMELDAEGFSVYLTVGGEITEDNIFGAAVCKLKQEFGMLT